MWWGRGTAASGIGRRECAYAAMNGHLAVLQWARAHGCLWDRNTFLSVHGQWWSRIHFDMSRRPNLGRNVNEKSGILQCLNARLFSVRSQF